MAENKTRATDASVPGFLAGIENAERRQDCEALVAMMSRVHYRYDSGREGDWAVTGFSPRKGDISVYLTCDTPAQPALLARLGKHRMGKACLYIRRLATWTWPCWSNWWPARWRK